jgi:hypothetical protein
MMLLRRIQRSHLDKNHYHFLTPSQQYCELRHVVQT